MLILYIEGGIFFINHVPVPYDSGALSVQCTQHLHKQGDKRLNKVLRYNGDNCIYRCCQRNRSSGEDIEPGFITNIGPTRISQVR